MSQNETTPIPVIDIDGELPPGRAGYDALMAASEASLAPDEFWVIDHEDGTLWATASKLLDAPIITFCDAMDCDWDQAQESGFRLAKLRRPQPPRFDVAAQLAAMGTDSLLPPKRKGKSR